MKPRNNWAGNRTAVTPSCAVDQTSSSQKQALLLIRNKANIPTPF